MRIRPGLFVALLLIAAAPPACISYAVERLPVVDSLPPPPAPEDRPSLTYTVRPVSSLGMNGTAGGFPDFNPERLNEEIPAVLAATGWFRSIEPAKDGEEGDLQLDLVLQSSGNDMIMVASACLLFIIPTWRTVTFDLTAEVRAKDGRWKRYQYEDEARDIYWLPLVLGMSFAPWGQVYPELRENMVRTLVLDLHTDGFLVRPAAP
jgi:hypothetical protein